MSVTPSASQEQLQCGEGIRHLFPILGTKVHDGKCVRLCESCQDWRKIYEVLLLGICHAASSLIAGSSCTLTTQQPRRSPKLCVVATG